MSRRGTTVVEARTYDFDAMLLQEAEAATSPVAIGPLINLAETAGSGGTAKELRAIQGKLGRAGQSSSGDDNYGYPADYRPTGGWSIESS